VNEFLPFAVRQTRVRGFNRPNKGTKSLARLQVRDHFGFCSGFSGSGARGGVIKRNRNVGSISSVDRMPLLPVTSDEPLSSGALATAMSPSSQPRSRRSVTPTRSGERTHPATPESPTYYIQSNQRRALRREPAVILQVDRQPEPNLNRIGESVASFGFFAL
jgi:hypothetical protein